MAISKPFVSSRRAVSVLAALCLSACGAYDPALLENSASLSGPHADGGTHNGDGGGVKMIGGSGTCKKGADMTACERPNADGVCLGGDCTIVRCRDNFSDCDGLADNGCETTLETVDSCGMCGAHCALNHALRNRCDPTTVTGPCAVDHGCQEGAVDCVPDALSNGCEAGFGDCDGLAGNGCEASLRTPSNCGACGKVCTSAVARASCDTGKCVLGGCADGFGDCDGKGCKNLANDPKNCGKCDNACNSDAPMCFGGRCTSKTCKKGEADCDERPANGCEADLTTAATCGSCDVRCGPYANASAGCVKAQCAITACAPGFADCDETRDNGCETDVTQNASCGMCGVDCGHLPHVTSAHCAMTACADVVCEAGWGDCDGKPETGCEQPLNTADHCETCTGTCNANHGTASCDTGKCVLSTCENGFDDCNAMVDDGCEAALDSNDTCGKCDNKCANGTACKNGGCACATAAGCTDGSECCSGACIDTSGTCVPWPCVPGSKRDQDNCGGCGVACLGYCCAGGI